VDAESDQGEHGEAAQGEAQGGVMTRWEAFIMGAIWSALRHGGESIKLAVEWPDFPPNKGGGELLVRGPDGTELLITVRETGGA
jgi:hypothetical protein